jgi:hypothetical protein
MQIGLLGASRAPTTTPGGDQSQMSATTSTPAPLGARIVGALGGAHARRPRIGHQRPIHRRAALIAGALAAAALIGACGSSSSSSSGTGHKLDTARIELSIQQSIASEKHMTSKVTCPAVVEQRAGNSFTCVATGTVVGRGGRVGHFSTPFTVEQVNGNGYVNYHS